MTDPDRNVPGRLVTRLMLLVIVVLVVGGVAWGLFHHCPPASQPATSSRNRLPATPMHGVYAGKSGQAAIDAARAHDSGAQPGVAAYAGTTSGKAIYNHLCHTCHTAGIAGAPKLGDTSAWAPRIAQGMPVLIRHALDGYTGPSGNRMPAKGGDPQLSATQVANAVKWMVKQSQ